MEGGGAGGRQPNGTFSSTTHALDSTTTGGVRRLQRQWNSSRAANAQGANCDFAPRCCSCGWNTGIRLLMVAQSRRMRLAALALAPFGAAGLSLTAAATSQGSAVEPALSASPSAVGCDEAAELDPPSKPDAKHRMLLGGRVAVSPAWVGPALHVPGRPGWYSQKEAIWVRAGGSEPLEVVVPTKWRSTVQIRFASGGGSSVRILNCKPPPAWYFYVGSISTRGRICVPLTFRLGNEQATRRFAVQSKPCSH